MLIPAKVQNLSLYLRVSLLSLTLTLMLYYIFFYTFALLLCLVFCLTLCAFDLSLPFLFVLLLCPLLFEWFSPCVAPCLVFGFFVFPLLGGFVSISPLFLFCLPSSFCSVFVVLFACVLTSCFASFLTHSLAFLLAQAGSGSQIPIFSISEHL